MSRSDSPFDYFFEFIMRKTEEDQSYMTPFERAKFVAVATESALSCALRMHEFMEMWSTWLQHSEDSE
jgi:hypothetical protein